MNYKVIVTYLPTMEVLKTFDEGCEIFTKGDIIIIDEQKYEVRARVWYTDKRECLIIVDLEQY
jgi:hypothetical protein